MSGRNPRTPTYSQVVAGAERALVRVSSWPAWKREFSRPSKPIEDQFIIPPEGDEITGINAWRAETVAFALSRTIPTELPVTLHWTEGPRYT